MVLRGERLARGSLGGLGGLGTLGCGILFGFGTFPVAMVRAWDDAFILSTVRAR